MRNKKLQGQTLFQVCEQKQNGLKIKDAGRKSPRKKSSPKGKRKLAFPSKKPALLCGKRFYLDLIGEGKTKITRNAINNLGGSVEEFVSKEVYCIITDRVTVEEVIALNKKGAQATLFPPTPSPLQQISSNKCYANSPLSTDSPQSFELKTLNATRGKALLKQVAGTQRQGSTNLLENARKWKVRVMHLDQFLNWSKEKISHCKPSQTLDEKKGPISSKASGSFRVKSLKSPFIKIEEHSRKYRPVYSELDEWPRINFETVGASCPFEKPKVKNGLAEKEMEQMSDKETNKDASSQEMSEKITESPKERKLDDIGGYCECCHVRFVNLKQHLKGDQHRAYATNNSNYAELDEVISRGNSFEHFMAAVKEKSEATKKAATNETTSCGKQLYPKITESVQIEATRKNEADARKAKQSPSAAVPHPDIIANRCNEVYTITAGGSVMMEANTVSSYATSIAATASAIAASADVACRNHGKADAYDDVDANKDASFVANNPKSDAVSCFAASVAVIADAEIADTDGGQGDAICAEAVAARVVDTSDNAINRAGDTTFSDVVPDNNNYRGSASGTRPALDKGSRVPKTANARIGLAEASIVDPNTASNGSIINDPIAYNAEVNSKIAIPCASKPATIIAETATDNSVVSKMEFNMDADVNANVVVDTKYCRISSSANTAIEVINLDTSVDAESDASFNADEIVASDKQAKFGGDIEMQNDIAIEKENVNAETMLIDSNNVVKSKSIRFSGAIIRDIDPDEDKNSVTSVTSNHAEPNLSEDVLLNCKLVSVSQTESIQNEDNPSQRMNDIHNQGNEKMINESAAGDTSIRVESPVKRYYKRSSTAICSSSPDKAKDDGNTRLGRMIGRQCDSVVSDEQSRLLAGNVSNNSMDHSSDIAVTPQNCSMRTLRKKSIDSVPGKDVLNIGRQRKHLRKRDNYPNQATSSDGECFSDMTQLVMKGRTNEKLPSKSEHKKILSRDEKMSSTVENRKTMQKQAEKRRSSLPEPLSRCKEDTGRHFKKGGSKTRKSLARFTRMSLPEELGKGNFRSPFRKRLRSSRKMVHANTIKNGILKKYHRKLRSPKQRNYYEGSSLLSSPSGSSTQSDEHTIKDDDYQEEPHFSGSSTVDMQNYGPSSDVRTPKADTATEEIIGKTNAPFSVDDIESKTATISSQDSDTSEMDLVDLQRPSRRRKLSVSEKSRGDSTNNDVTTKNEVQLGPGDVACGENPVSFVDDVTDDILKIVDKGPTAAFIDIEGQLSPGVMQYPSVAYLEGVIGVGEGIVLNSPNKGLSDFQSIYVDEKWKFSSPGSEMEYKNKVSDILNLLNSPSTAPKIHQAAGNTKCKKSLSMPPKPPMARDEVIQNKENIETKACEERKRKRSEDRLTLKPAKPKSKQAKETTNYYHSSTSKDSAQTCESQANSYNTELIKKLQCQGLLDDSLPTSDSGNSMVCDLNDFLIEDLRKGISMHERIKSRKRHATVVGLAERDVMLTPPKKRTSNKPSLHPNSPIDPVTPTNRRTSKGSSSKCLSLSDKQATIPTTKNRASITSKTRHSVQSASVVTPPKKRTYRTSSATSLSKLGNPVNPATRTCLNMSPGPMPGTAGKDVSPCALISTDVRETQSRTPFRSSADPMKTRDATSSTPVKKGRPQSGARHTPKSSRKEFSDPGRAKPSTFLSPVIQSPETTTDSSSFLSKSVSGSFVLEMSMSPNTSNPVTLSISNALSSRSRAASKKKQALQRSPGKKSVDRPKSKKIRLACKPSSKTRTAATMKKANESFEFEEDGYAFTEF